MNDNQRQFRELQPLVDRMLDGLIARDELERLEKALEGNAELQKLILEYSQVHLSLHCDVRSKKVVDAFVGYQGQLPTVHSAAASENVATFPTVPLELAEHNIGGEPAPPAQSQPASWFGSGLGFTTWPMALMFCLGIAAALVGTGIAQRERNASNSLTLTAMPVAYLTSNTGCAWGNDSLKLQTVGSSVQLGDEISLQQGIAEFRLANGVYISVEGPAGLVLTSPDSLVLQYGKLATHVPWTVSEFRILAGACRLAATNAEFGVLVASSHIDTHVFSGEVLATNTLLMDEDADRDDDDRETPVADEANFSKSVVSQGRALVVGNLNGTLTISRWKKAAPSLFATKLTMAGQLPITTSYCDAVRASRPFGYWRFESTKNGVVTSEIPGAPDLNIVEDLRLSGLSGNRVAEFRPGAKGYLVSRENVDALAKTEYSMEVWVKPSHVHSGAVLGLCAVDRQSQREKSAFLLQLHCAVGRVDGNAVGMDYAGSIRFLHRDPPERNRRLGSSCFSKKPYSVRRWQHIVAVKRAELMELYVDGKLSASIVDKTLLASSLHMVVGRQESVGSDYQFIGQLDELAVYPRALDAEEISSHYKAVDWAEVKEVVEDSKDS